MSVKQSLQRLGHRIAAKRRTLVAILLIAFLFIPLSSQSQILPSPCCAILSAGLGSVASAISNVIGGALNAVNATMTSIELFERTVVWPQNLINQAKTAVGTFRGIFNQLRGIAQISVASATLPATQRLERTLLSADANLISSVDAHYTAVYSSVPPPSDATPEVRDLVDMTDAMAQAAMKRGIEIDAIADLEMQAADRILRGEIARECDRFSQEKLNGVLLRTVFQHSSEWHRSFKHHVGHDTDRSGDSANQFSRCSL